jgi:hypothetical protein
MSLVSLSDYERFVYGLQDSHSEVVLSTLRLYSTSALTALLEGELTLQNGLVIRVMEVLDFKVKRIRNYSYAVYRDGIKIRWYDAQPHPENPDLAPTFPHHYHEEPDIEHNRRPAPAISFESQNLLSVIEDCLHLI